MQMATSKVENSAQVSSFTMKFDHAQQGDQKSWKKLPKCCKKVAKIVAKPKKVKISSLKLNLTVQIIFIKPLLNS